MVPTARILADRRLLVSVLGLLAIANFIGLAMVVGPIRSRVHTLTQRATVATLSVSTWWITEPRPNSCRANTAPRDSERERSDT